MIETLPYVLTNPKAATTFFREAERCLKTLIPTSRKTATLYTIRFGGKGTVEDYEDLLQECLAALWENIKNGKVNSADKIDGYISSLARNQMLIQIKASAKPQNDDDEDLSGSYEDSLLRPEIIEAANTFHLYKIKSGPKKVFQFSRDFVFLNSFEDTAQASRATGVDMSSIWRCLTHERKTAGGYIWLYSNDKISELMKYEN